VYIFQAHGACLSLKRWSSFLGTNRHALDYLEECLGQEVYRPAIEQKVMELYEESMERQGLQPGVTSFLQEAKRAGLKVGLASSSLRLRIEPYLRKFGLFQYFDCIRTGIDASSGKPDPELYVSVTDGLGVLPQEAVAFEDSLHGLQAAKRAGLFCVVVPNQVTCHLTFSGYDVRLDSLDQIDLGEVIAKIEQKGKRRETSGGET
ncbi:HAD-IA family hydrolase, partial [Frankia sp. Cpl3]|nr:HAD-IA family hydrolase [Frankia sp. Cpl3]